MAKKYQGFLDSTENKIIKDQSLLKFEAIKKEIQILPNLKALIPPLSLEEFSQLEENIKKDGCREAILIWETKKINIDSGTLTPDAAAYILIDGHNRFEICTKFNIDFKIHIVNYENIDQVKDFMIDNQLGRRNITPEQASYLRGLKYNAEKKNRGQYSREMQSGQIVHFDEKGSKSTAQKLAEQYHVNEKTIRRDADYADGIELLPVEFKQEILAGKSSFSKAEIIELGKEKDTSDVATKVNQLLVKKMSGSVVTEKKTSSPIKEKILSLVKILETQEDCDEIIKQIKLIKKKMQV
jgi:hypothetical protein